MVRIEKTVYVVAHLRLCGGICAVTPLENNIS